MNSRNMSDKKSIRPLDNITVVTIEQAVAAPFCTRQLADLGARVIKIERPDGGDFARQYDERVNGLSSHFVWINRGKESLTLDLKADGAYEVILALLAKADVFVQNLAPRATERLGLDYETLKSIYPQLIVCDISGYGRGGPDEQRKAYDLLVQGEAGLMSVTGGVGRDEIAKTGNSSADISAGMYAYSGILSALILRERTGEGAHIDVSMLESLVEWMNYPLYYSYQGAEPPPRTGANHATIYPYGLFSAKDGDILIGLQNEREWKLFCNDVLHQSDLTSDPRFSQNSLRSQNRVVLKAIIDAVFKTLSLTEVMERLEDASIANGRANQMKDIWDHQQLKARNRWRVVQSSVGEIPALLPPALNNRFEYAMGDIPALGQHSDALFKEFGFDPITLVKRD